jgi:hypothetical protein
MDIPEFPVFDSQTFAAAATSARVKIVGEHPGSRAGKFTSRLTAADTGGGAPAALCARACNHCDRLDLCVRAWQVDLAVLCGPSALPTEGSLLAKPPESNILLMHQQTSACLNFAKLWALLRNSWLYDT